MKGVSLKQIGLNFNFTVMVVNEINYRVANGSCMDCQMEHDSKGCLGRNGICSPNSRTIFIREERRTSNKAV